MRLIDADVLGIGKCNPDVFDDKGYAKGWNSAIEILQNAPTVDAVPVCRCKDCKHLSVRSGALGVYQCAIHGDYPSGEYFCADGERKGGEE